jgi:hypothetical protein
MGSVARQGGECVSEKLTEQLKAYGFSHLDIDISIKLIKYWVLGGG